MWKVASFHFKVSFRFIFFKNQSFLHVILPSPEQEMEVKYYVVAIFALKVCSLKFIVILDHLSTVNVA